MAGQTSSSKTRRAPAQATRFILYRTPQGYWIASARDGRVTGAFSVPSDTARFALRQLQPGGVDGGMRRARPGPARRS